MIKVLNWITFSTLVMSICLINNAFGGSMSNLPYSKIKNPEQLFEIELKMYNRESLSELIPSIEAPLINQEAVKFKSLKNEKDNSNSQGLASKLSSGSSYDDITAIAKQNNNYSKSKYIFGSIKYKNDFDYRIDTSVTLTIHSPNNPNLLVSNVMIHGINTEKVYFLVYADNPVMNTSDEEVVLNFKINDARAK